MNVRDVEFVRLDGTIVGKAGAIWWSGDGAIMGYTCNFWWYGNRYGDGNGAGHPTDGLVEQAVYESGHYRDGGWNNSCIPSMGTLR